MTLRRSAFGTAEDPVPLNPMVNSNYKSKSTEFTSVSGTPVASGAKQPWTVTSGAWLPLKKAVSISKPTTMPLPTPNLIITQSPSGESLWRLVSHPSNQAPFSVKVFARRMGGNGLSKLCAEAKNSSEYAIILPPRADETRSFVHDQLRYNAKVELLVRPTYRRMRR